MGELLALPLETAVDLNLPWLINRHVTHEAYQEDGSAAGGDGGGGVLKAGTAQSLLRRCASHGPLSARARIAATLASSITTDARGLCTLLSSVVVHEWNTAGGGAHTDNRDTAEHHYFKFPDGPTATLAFLLEHPEITFTPQQRAHAAKRVRQILEEALEKTYIEPLAGSNQPYASSAILFQDLRSSCCCCCIQECQAKACLC